MKTFQKQPNDHLDYDLVLTDWLSEDDEITSVDVQTPPGIEVTQTGIEPDRVKFWIKGGASGKSYKFSPLIYTKSRIKEVDFLIIVVEM